MGLVSLIDKILNPLACNALNAVSLPEPGPFTSTSIFLRPNSAAFIAASSAATCAAYGVDFLEPLILWSQQMTKKEHCHLCR